MRTTSPTLQANISSIKVGLLENHKDHPQTFNIDEIELKFASYIIRTLTKILIQNTHSHIFPLNSTKLHIKLWVQFSYFQNFDIIDLIIL